MDENILYDLFIGHINPSGYKATPTTDYVEASDTLEKIRKEFFEDFSEEEQRKFWKLNNCYKRIKKMEQYDSFCYGVRLSIQLMMEATKPVYYNRNTKMNVDIDRIKEEMNFD